jgi:histidinol phosphatase-like PHP family hydrolase
MVGETPQLFGRFWNYCKKMAFSINNDGFYLKNLLVLFFTQKKERKKGARKRNSTFSGKYHD